MAHSACEQFSQSGALGEGELGFFAAAGLAADQDLLRQLGWPGNLDDLVIVRCFALLRLHQRQLLRRQLLRRQLLPLGGLGARHGQNI